MLTATVKNVRVELQKVLIEQGYSLDDQLDINILDKLADEIGLPQVKVEVFQFHGHSRNQRNEDGSPNE